MPPNSNAALVITRGDTLSIHVTMESGGAPLNLTGYTITSQIRKGRGATALLLATFAITVTNASAGQFTMELSAEQTAALYPANFDVNSTTSDDSAPQYDIKLVSPGGVVSRTDSWLVRLNEGITQ